MATDVNGCKWKIVIAANDMWWQWWHLRCARYSEYTIYAVCFCCCYQPAKRISAFSLVGFMECTCAEPCWTFCPEKLINWRQHKTAMRDTMMIHDDGWWLPAGGHQTSFARVIDNSGGCSRRLGPSHKQDSLWYRILVLLRSKSVSAWLAR